MLVGTFCEGLKYFLWGHWYVYFRLLVTSPLGFKGKVDSLACMFYRMPPQIDLWCDTCWPLGGQHGSRTIWSTYLHRYWVVGISDNLLITGECVTLITTSYRLIRCTVISSCPSKQVTVVSWFPLYRTDQIPSFFHDFSCIFWMFDFFKLKNWSILANNMQFI